MQSKKKATQTHLCAEFTLLCWIATVLEGLFGEYHSPSAALDQQHPEVTKQLLVCDWLVTPETLMTLNGRFPQNTEGNSCRGKYSTVKRLG